MPSLKAMAREAQKKLKNGALKQLPNRKQTLFKSTERVADSDLESETESESSNDSEDGSAVTSLPLSKANGHGKERVGASGDVDSSEEVENKSDKESESESEASAELSGNRSHDSGQSSDESKSVSDSESEEEEGHTTVTVAAQKPSSYMEEEISTKLEKPREILIYNPPDGFTTIPKNNAGKQNVTEVLSPSNLAGKQLWHIIAPASVPISEIKEVSLRDVQLGQPALTFNGHHYSFIQEQAGDRGNTKVLIPDCENVMYRVGQRVIDQTLRLQQIVRLPNVTDYAISRSANSQVPELTVTLTKRPARTQPEGLKMRFRPIGFGNGKTGTIGSSSSSYASSPDTDTDGDEEMEDAPLTSQQPLGINNAHAHLSKLASKATANQDDSSSSGEGTDDGPPAAAKDAALAKSPSRSDEPSEKSNIQVEDAPEISSRPRKMTSSSMRILKRKLSDLKKDDNASNFPSELTKTNSTSLKASILRTPVPTPGKLSSNKENGNASTANRKILPPGSKRNSTGPANTTQILPLQATKDPSSPLVAPKQKQVTPIQPQRRLSTILPVPGNSIKLSKNSQSSITTPSGVKNPLGSAEPADGLILMKAVTEKSEATPSIGPGARISAGKDIATSLESRIRAVDPTLGEKGRKRQARRSRKNNASRVSTAQRRESVKSATSDTFDRPINASPPSQNVWRLPSEIKPSPKPSMSEVLTRDTKLGLALDVEKASKRSKKQPSKSNTPSQDGKKTKSSHEAPTSTAALSPRRVSVILPPKLSRPVPK